MSHTLRYIDQAADAFFAYVDARYFDDNVGWKEDYGRCTSINSSPVKCLVAAGHSCKVQGMPEDKLRRYGMGVHGGHDWLVVDDRWIVDIWAKAYTDFPKAVFDLHDAQDAAFIEKAYGPKEEWETVWEAGTPGHWEAWTEHADQDWQEFRKQRSPEAGRIVDEMLSNSRLRSPLG